MRKQKRRSVAIIGVGNWGSSFASALLAAGLPPHEVIVPSLRRRSASGSGKWTRALPLTTLEHADLEADILWLCVPDGIISAVTARLLKRLSAKGSKAAGKLVVHSSGALSVKVLQAAARAGASVASVHPFMSFPTRVPVGLQGVPFGIEADFSSRPILNSIVRKIGGRPFSVESEKKALYHAGGMLSSPLLVSHLVAAQQAAELAGFSPRQALQLIEPIVRATVENVFLRGADKSFSGPIARADTHTIRLHLRALESHPMLAGVYRSLAVYAVEALPSPGAKQLRRLLRPR